VRGLRSIWRGDDLAGLAFHQQRGDFALARGQLCRHGAFLADIFERPDARSQWLARQHGVARDMAPEQFTITAAHDALVRIAALGVHDGDDAVTRAQEFVVRGVEYFEGLVVELGARIAEHGCQRLVAAAHDTVSDMHMPTGACRKMLS